jgi:ubiquitin
MEIFIKTLTGKTLTVCVGQDDTTQVLQEKIREQEGIPADQQRLIYDGRQMQDDDTLGYCNIQS